MSSSFDLDDEPPSVQQRVKDNVARLEFISNMQDDETMNTMMQSLGLSNNVNTGLNLDSIDSQEEHTPSNEEYKALQQSATFLCVYVRNFWEPNFFFRFLCPTLRRVWTNLT